MTAEDYAKSLRNANATKIAISPLRENGLTDIDLAYAVQKINTNHRLNGGARIVGKKIGLTSTAVQTQLGVDQPDYGILFDEMEVLNGLELSNSRTYAAKSRSRNRLCTC